MTVHKTYCRHCTSLCGLEVNVEDNRPVSLKGDPSSPISRGYSCMMGQHNLLVHDAPDRLHTAQKRTADGQFVAMPTMTALREIGDRLGELRDKWGPRSIALYYGTGSFYSALAYGMAKTWLRAIGSPELYTSLTVDQSAKWVCALRMGVFATGKPIHRDLDAMMFVGLNPVISHQGIFNALECPNPLKQLAEARAAGVKSIVVDPRRTETAQRADIHLQIMPGEDATLFAALIREVLVNGWEDQAFCARFVTSVDRLRHAVEDFTLDYAAQRCGVPASQIAAAARVFGTARRRSTASGTGSNMSRRSNLNEFMMEALNAICGGYRKAGDPLRHTGGLFNAIPSVETVIPPNRTWESGPRLRTADIGLMGTEFPTPKLPDEILHPGDDRIRALIAFGGNPATSIGDNRKTIGALKSLELLVSVDPRMSETGRYADYVIPTKLPLERMDMTVTQDHCFSRNFIQFSEALIQPPDNVIEDWEVFYELARRMNVELDYQTGPHSIDMPHVTKLDMANKPTTEDMFRATCAAGRVTLDQLRASPGGLLLPSDDIVKAAATDDGHRLDVCPDDVFNEVREMRAEPVKRDASLPFLLISRRLKRVMNTAYHDFPAVKAKWTMAPLAMHPADAAANDLCENMIVHVQSASSRIIGRLTLDDTLKPGVVSMPMGWGSSDPDDPCSSLTGHLVSLERHVEPINFMPVFSGIAVAISAAELSPASQLSLQDA